jgi:MIP family channel proteins
MSDVAIEIHTPTNLDNRESIYVDNSSNFNCPIKLVKESLFEFFGMYIFISLSLGNVAIFSLYPAAQLNWTGMSISWGLNLMFGIYMSSFQSKSHLNPAFSLCSYIFENMTFKELVCYTLSQLFGAFMAAVTVYGIYFNNLGSDDQFSSIFVTYKQSTISDTSAFFTEFLGTAMLVGGIFMLIDNSKTKEHLPIYIGAWLSVLVFAFGYQTAFAWNPARDLGPRILTAIAGYDSFSYMDYYWWIPLIADYTGAIFGTIIYKFLIKEQSY